MNMISRTVSEQRVLCDVIPCVWPLLDHGSRPMKVLEFLTLLYKTRLRWPRRAMTVNNRRFFLPLHSSFFPLQNYTRRYFLQNYTRRFFNAIITCDVFPKITLAVFLELRFRLRVSLRMKMGAIIRLVCFIQTKNHVNTVQNFTFQSVNYEYNAILYLTMSLSNQRTKFVPHDHGIFQRIL